MLQTSEPTSGDFKSDIQDSVKSEQAVRSVIVWFVLNVRSVEARLTNLQIIWKDVCAVCNLGFKPQMEDKQC